MPAYRNLRGDSPIQSYEMGETYIYVTFSNGKTYRYSHRKAGLTHVHEMKRLAQLGQGLSTYIQRNVRNLYD